MTWWAMEVRGMTGDCRERSGVDGGCEGSGESAARGVFVREPYESIGRKRCWSVSAATKLVLVIN